MKQTLVFSFSMLALPVAAQEETRTYQLEISAGAFGLQSPATSNWLYHAGAGINLPGKKEGWYTNFALDYNHDGRFFGKGTDYFSLTAGKNRQWVDGHFYASLGLNGGLFFSHPAVRYDHYNWTHTGIAVHPRAEIGLAYEKVKFSFGVYLSIGAGYYSNPEWEAEQGTYIVDPKGPPSWFRMTGAMCPYVKVTF